MTLSGPPWITALSHPTSEHYNLLAHNPNANAWRPTLWLLVSGLLAGLLGSGAQYLSHQAELRNLSVNELLLQLGPWLIGLMLSSLIGFIVIVTIQHLIAVRLGGKGTFGQQAYVVGAITAPLLVLTVILASPPIVNVIAPLIVLFGALMVINALRAVYGFGWLRALLSSFVVWLIVLVALLAAIFYVLGPRIGDRKSVV